MWIYQDDLEGLCIPWWNAFDSLAILRYCTYLGGMPLVFHLQAFTSDCSGGPFILGLRVVGLVWSIPEVWDLGGSFDDLLYHLLPLFCDMLLCSWASSLGKAHYGSIPI